MRHSLRTAFIIIVALSTLVLCKKQTETANDFQKIIESDTLRVLTLNTSTSYFIYREQEMGYQYDMIKSFADEKGLILKIVTAKNSVDLFNKLQNNEGDIIAYGMPIENEMKDVLFYCGLSEISHQVLIQRAERSDTVLKDVTELIGKDIYVTRGSKYDNRLNNLNRELGGGINIKHLDKDTIVVEDLIRMVSMDSIRFTVAEDNVARLNQTYFLNIDIGMQISFDQRTSWAVRKDTPVLADSLNAWYERVHKESDYLRLAKRYFEESKGFTNPYEFYTVSLMKDGQISLWDNYFKKYAAEYNIDWRLIAAISFHESTFKPDVKSWAGAMGLMGIMPATALSMGVNNTDLYDPETNVMIGTRYLKSLLNTFSTIEDETERMKMALASYNGGIGHIFDARALAEKYNANKDVWNGNVEKYLQLKRLEQYYRDPVCRTGYFRADETVNYVHNVMSRWESYKKEV